MAGSNIINQLDEWYAQFVYGPLHRFAFAANAGMTGTQVELLLRQYGIRIWGREMHDPTERAFKVRRSQAVWAEYLLCRSGVPLLTPLLDARNAAYQAQHAAADAMPVPWSKSGIGAHSFVDRAVDLVAWLAGDRPSR